MAKGRWSWYRLPTQAEGKARKFKVKCQWFGRDELDLVWIIISSRQDCEKLDACSASTEDTSKKSLVVVSEFIRCGAIWAQSFIMEDLESIIYHNHSAMVGTEEEQRSS